MTDSPETKTAEQIIAEALYEVWNFKTFHDAEEAAKVATDALHAAGLLVSGAPSEERIERAWAVMNAYGIASQLRLRYTGKREREVVAEMLTAAGVTPPATVDAHAKPVDTTTERIKNVDDPLHVTPVLPSSGVDEDALAEVIGYAYNSEHYAPATHAARAVAEWLKGQGR